MIEAQWIGDIPAGEYLEPLERAGEPLTVADYESAELVLTGPDGVTIATIPATLEPAEDALSFAWPAAPSLFTLAGVHTITPRLTTAAGRYVRADDLVFVVQADDGWHSLASLRREWRDAPDSDVRVHELLEVARLAVLTYAAQIALEPAPRPSVSFRLAQFTQARNVWNAAKVDAGGGMGEDSFVIRPFPLDWMVRQIIKPKRSVPAVG